MERQFGHFTYAPPIRSFFSMVKLKGKKVAIFCCHEGTKGKTLENIKKELSGNAFLGETDFLNVKKEREKYPKSQRVGC